MALTVVTCRSVVCATPAYLSASTLLQVQDLAHHNCLTYSYRWFAIFEGTCARICAGGGCNFSGKTSNLLLSATLQDCGISLQPRHSVASLPERANWLRCYRRGSRRVWASMGCMPPEQMSPLLRSFYFLLNLYGAGSARQ